MRFKFFTLLTFLFIGIHINAQFPVYSQYWTNKFLINPAVAGHEGYTSINLTARKQWAGVDDAPTTFALSAQSRLLRQSHISRGRILFKNRRRKPMSRSGRVGIGGYLFSDNTGVLTKTGFQGTYAYHLDLRGSALSFGVSLVGLQFGINKDEIITTSQIEENQIDYLIAATADRGYLLEGNFGAYYSDQNLYAGFSVQNLFESLLKLNNRVDSAARFKTERIYSLMGGYRYDVIDFLYIEPSVNIKFSEIGIAQMDLNLTGYFKEDYWAGVAFRNGSGSKIAAETIGGRGSSLIFYGGVRIDKFFFGYSFDYSFSSLQRQTWGSHEIMLAVRFGDNARRYRWLNRY